VVQAVSNGQEALARLDEVRADLVLTDLVMPVMDGLGLMRALRQSPTLNRVPIIVMSASASNDTRAEAVESGCAAFLPKPLKLGDLLRTIGDQLSLEWRYKDTAAERTSRETGASDSFRLSPELAAELRHLAMQGDVLGITARVDTILVSDNTARAFCNEMHALASRFDIRGIREALASKWS
jgi:CheY-like chemotaxis protein